MSALVKRDNHVVQHTSVHIHPTAVVHPGAKLGRGVEIGPFCLVGENVELGDGTRLLSNVVINGETTIGERCEIHPFAVIGATSQDKKYKGERSYVRIGDRNVIREFVTIHRGTGDGTATVIGDDCYLLAYVHVAHNCQIGNRVVMSNLSQLAGHVAVGDGANIGGMAGIHQFVRVGQMVMVGGMTKVVKDIPPFMMVGGNPASLRGLNKEGLRRNRVPEDTVTELKDAFRILFRSNNTLIEALNELQSHVKTPEGRDLAAFFESSDRGVLKR